MGKQLSAVLKNRAERIYGENADKFSTDFEKNKETMKALGLFAYSKTDRNIVAGFVTRLAKRKKTAED
jgi:ribosomal protein S17E